MKKFLIVLFIVLLLVPVGVVMADEGDIVPEAEAEIPCTNCEVLPDSPEPEAEVSVVYEVEAAVPNTGNAVMDGELTVPVEGTNPQEVETFKDVVAVCADEDDVIYLGTETDFTLGLVTDVSILNQIASEFSIEEYTEEEAYVRGTRIDDILGEVENDNYDEAIRYVRDASRNVPDSTIVWVAGDDVVSSWWGFPDASERIQSLLFWIPECEVEVVDPTPVVPVPVVPVPVVHVVPVPAPIFNTGGDF